MNRAPGTLIVLALVAGGHFAALPAAQGAVTVASKMFTESVVLGEILKQTLEAAGIKPVKHKAELGGTRVLFDGLVAGEIDAYVEYTGTLREEIFAGQDVATDEALAAALAKRGIAMSAPLGFNNPYAMAVLRDTSERIVVDWAMRYGNPSIDSKLQALQGEGCERILVVPLYPQYAAATTATVNDKVFESLMKMRWQPAVRTAPAYHDDPAYIDALASSMEQSLAALDFAPEVVLASFHGIPLSYFRKGDPYHCHCQKTARLLRARLGWPDEKLLVTFQSRFGPEEWLQPYTDKTVERLAREGVRRIAVVTPGFAADCLETLEEIAGENAEIFHEHGGKDFAFLPSLNDSPEGMSVIGAIARRELSGWL